MTQLTDRFKEYMLVNHRQTMKDGSQGAPTFRAIPLSGDAAYLNMEYDPTTSKLVMCTKTIKQELQAVPKMLPSGEFEMAKNPKPGTPGVLFERRLLPGHIKQRFHRTNTGNLDLQKVSKHEVVINVRNYVEYRDQRIKNGLIMGF